MRTYLLWSMLVLILPCTAQAQFFFKKSAAKNPAQRVPQLLEILRADPDERKRSAAAEELRDYDAKTHPEIVPILAEAALKDSKATVRSDALSSLSRMRPVSNTAGQALEQAAAHDAQWSNRMQAKSALMRYQWAGYNPQNPEAKAASQEPPKQNPQTAANQRNALPAITTIPSTGKPGTPTVPVATQLLPRDPTGMSVSGNPPPNQKGMVTMSRPMENHPGLPLPNVANVQGNPYGQSPTVIDAPPLVVPHAPVISSGPNLGLSTREFSPLVANPQIPSPSDSGLQFKPVQTNSLPSNPVSSAPKEVPLIDLNSVLTPQTNPGLPPLVNNPGVPGIVIPLPPGNNLPLPAPNGPEIPKF